MLLCVYVFVCVSVYVYVCVCVIDSVCNSLSKQPYGLLCHMFEHVPDEQAVFCCRMLTRMTA